MDISQKTVLSLTITTTWWKVFDNLDTRELFIIFGGTHQTNKKNLYGAMSQFGIGVLPHFEKHKKRSKRVGKFPFENLIRLEVLESEVALIGHSLGARVIYYCGINWSSYHSRKLKSVFLLGGAIARNAKWEQVTSCCKV